MQHIQSIVSHEILHPNDFGKIFNDTSKLMCTPLISNNKLFKNMNPNSIEELKNMECILYSNTICNVIYAMIGTRGDIANAME